MIYAESIIVPANTLESSKQRTKIKVTNGILTQIKILFPKGCAGLVKVQLFAGGHQFVPSTFGQFVRGDDVLIEFPEFVEVTDSPRFIDVLTSSEGTVYQHTIDVLIVQLPREAVLPIGAADGIIKSLRNLFIRERSE